ncbi:hypothetical protein [Cohnella sp. AR92]|uniref:hypothetical protein n=1 Tax=Cohnella sp. AR92 TaxID=648716 RepID=UPI001EDEEE3B|nr:hypothetical protein [Cohnella sp. AR92]
MKSPGGSEYPYYYKGGEIHCLKYGSKYKDQEKLFEIMRQEEEFIKLTNKKHRIWIDLYKTTTTNKVRQELVQNLINMNEQIIKISFVGLSGFSKWRLKRMLKRSGISCPISFYSDPEDAKTWLVNERK